MDPQMQMDITDDDKLWALLTWLLAPIVPVLVLFLEDKKARPFLKYNAIQAIVVSVAAYLISSILLPVFIGCVLWPASVGYIIYLAIQAYQGKIVVVPVVTDFCKNQGWI